MSTKNCPVTVKFETVTTDDPVATNVEKDTVLAEDTLVSVIAEVLPAVTDVKVNCATVVVVTTMLAVVSVTDENVKELPSVHNTIDNPVPVG